MLLRVLRFLSSVLVEIRCFFHSRGAFIMMLLAFVLASVLTVASAASDHSIAEIFAVTNASQFSLLAGVSTILFVGSDMASGGHIFLVERRRYLVVSARVVASFLISVFFGLMAILVSFGTFFSLFGGGSLSFAEVLSAMVLVSLVVLTSAGLSLMFRSRLVALVLYLVLPVVSTVLLRAILGVGNSCLNFSYCYENLALRLIERSVFFLDIFGALCWVLGTLLIGVVVTQRRSV